MKTLIRLLLDDLGLQCLPIPICPKTLDHYGTGLFISSFTGPVKVDVYNAG